MKNTYKIYARALTIFLIMWGFSIGYVAYRYASQPAQWQYVGTITYPCGSYLNNMYYEYGLSVDAAKHGDAAGRDYHYNRYLMWRDLYLQHCT